MNTNTNHKSSRRELFQTLGIGAAAGIGIATGTYADRDIDVTRNEILKGLLTVDPALFKYTELPSRINTGITSVHSISVDRNDNIFAAGSRGIKSFTATGQTRAFSLSLENKIDSFYISDDLTFYVGCGNQIFVFDPDGSQKAQWRVGDQNTMAASIGVYKDDLFVADAGNRTIHHTNTNGTKQNEIGDFVLPSHFFDLAVDGPDHLYAANTGNHRIERYNFNGNLTAWWGEFSMTDPAGFCGCCNPVSFALLPNDEGFITCEKGITRVKAFDIDGTFSGFLAGPEQFNKNKIDLEHIHTGFSPDGLDVAVDSNGRVLVLDSQQKEIRIFVKNK